MKQTLSAKKTVKAFRESECTPATPDSEAIARRIKSFEYKPGYSKAVLAKYERLCRGGK